jgi:hypothetical protein
MNTLDLQTEKADDSFAEYAMPDGITVVDSDGWQTDGIDRLLKRFYYEDTDKPSENSLTASFCVNFKCDELLEGYVNW